MDPADDDDEVEPGLTLWPVKAGGIWRCLHAHSPALAYLVLFLLAFSGHAYGSWLHENEQLGAEGERPISLAQHLAGAQFWFESMQNWQSEFLAVLSIVVLSIFLRQDKSPESKPLAALHSQTGT